MTRDAKLIIGAYALLAASLIVYAFLGRGHEWVIQVGALPGAILYLVLTAAHQLVLFEFYRPIVEAHVEDFLRKLDERR